MKIAYVINSGNYGGMEWHVIFLAEGMIKKGNDVFVWCKDGPIVAELEKIGAKVTKQGIGFDIDPGYVLKLSKFLKKNTINIVHAHELKAGTNAVLAGFLSGVKIRVSHIHTPLSEWPINRLIKFLTKLGYSTMVNLFSTFEIALTPSRKKVKHKEGIRNNKLHVIQNANAVKVREFDIDQDLKKEYRKEMFERHSIPESALVWGCVGRTTEEKGHKVLLDAFNTFYNLLSAEEKKRHYMLIVGGGDLEDYLRDKVREYGLSDRVFITGRFETEDQVKYFSSIDVFVHPSLAEGFGMVLVEAMVSGIPVIASALEVFKEVAADTVSFFDIGDALALAKEMAKLNEDFARAKSLSKKAQKRAASLFSFESFVDAYEEFYLELLRF